MKILFHFGHPAHFHLFKNVINKLLKADHDPHILIKEKDVLKRLLDDGGFQYANILPEGKSHGKTGLVIDLLRRGRRILRYCKEHRPDLLIGTSADISYVGKMLGVPAVNVNEDDASVIPLHAWIAYPWATAIISPDSCNNGRWQKKTITYAGYHELAYLHPELFNPDKKIVEQYVSLQRPYFVLRFANLHAHHDVGIKGITDEIALKLIEKLKFHGNVLITSERELSEDLEPFRLPVNPSDMHHLLAFAKIVIGDSQTMAAEAGVLGTPFIRFNDFVGRIGYLKELEEIYKLGFGIPSDQSDRLLQKAEELASDKNVTNKFQERRNVMLSEKINVADFLYNYINNIKS
ncbi:DUF354 domain-containing protein [Balneolales bacterium ANBcel1]|nr:DUF354 domain-containing protein [Balneolales bacterium ANBcel1]